MARWGWQGWEDGEDGCDPPEPGKEWLTITDDGEEAAIIVLRVDAPSLAGPETLAAARVEREALAERIVRAMNALEVRGA